MELKKHFSQKCREVFISYEKEGKDLYLRLPEYTTLVAPRVKRVDESMEIMRMQRVKEAYQEIFKLSMQAVRDTSSWRRSLFESVCLKSMAQCTRTTDESLFNAYFFRLKRLGKRFRSSAARSLLMRVGLSSDFLLPLMLWWQRWSTRFNQIYGT